MSKKLTGTLKGTGRFDNNYDLDFSGALDFDGVMLDVKITGWLESTPSFGGSLSLKCAEGEFEASLSGNIQAGNLAMSKYNVSEARGCFSEFRGGDILIGFKYFIGGDKRNLTFRFT